MISGVSSTSYSSYTSASTGANATASKKFQEQLLARLDSDGDGSISKDELNTAVASSDSKDGITVSLSEAFSSLDSNEDDSLNADELAAINLPPPPPRGGQPDTEVAQSLLSALDSDGDGTINSDELKAGLSNAGSSADSSQVFDALDTNKDGTVSLEELTASLQPQQPPPLPSSTDSSAQLFSALDSDTDGSISATELSSALNASNSSQSTDNGNDATAQALSRMVAALTERYDTEGSKPVGKYLNTAA